MDDFKCNNCKIRIRISNSNNFKFKIVKIVQYFEIR